MKLFKLFGTHYIIGCVPLNNMYWTSANFGGFWNTGAFVIRGHHFTEWRQVPDTPGASPGPDEPEDAPTPGGPGAA